jgi:hypothetical protein
MGYVSTSTRRRRNSTCAKRAPLPPKARMVSASSNRCERRSTSCMHEFPEMTPPRGATVVQAQASRPPSLAVPIGEGRTARCSARCSARGRRRARCGSFGHWSYRAPCPFQGPGDRHEHWPPGDILDPHFGENPRRRSSDQKFTSTNILLRRPGSHSDPT